VGIVGCGTRHLALQGEETVSYCISVILLPVDRSELPTQLESWHDVWQLLNERYKHRDELGWHDSVSRNWWHQDALNQICRGLGIKGLGFIYEEIVCLDRAELELAAAALDTVSDSIKYGIPDLGDAEIEHGAIWHLRHTYSDGEYRLVHTETFERAFRTAKLSDAENYGQTGFKALVSFYAYVKLFRQVVKNTITEDKSLLYVKPQPW
jgi:hypothetical protein